MNPPPVRPYKIVVYEIVPDDKQGFLHEPALVMEIIDIDAQCALEHAVEKMNDGI